MCGRFPPWKTTTRSALGKSWFSANSETPRKSSSFEGGMFDFGFARSRRGAGPHPRRAAQSGGPQHHRGNLRREAAAARHPRHRRLRRGGSQQFRGFRAGRPRDFPPPGVDLGQSHTTVPGDTLFKLPPGIDPLQAAMLKVNPATAWQPAPWFRHAGRRLMDRAKRRETPRSAAA